MRDETASTPPVPLLCAAALVVLEGLLLLAYGILEAAHVEQARLVMGVTTALFFILLAAMLIAGGWLLVRGQAWPRSPIVVAQVMFLGLAWSFRGGDTTWVAVGLAVVALVVLGGLMHPASVAALAEPDPPQSGPGSGS
jgi:hypothetical protein